MARVADWPFGLPIPSWDVTVVPSGNALRSEASPAQWETLTEAELVAACLEGHSAAFEAIVERHRRPVYRLCYRFAGNHEDASDLSQDVFLRAYRGLKRFRAESSLGTWLHRIAVNVCLNRLAVKAPRTEPLEADQHVDTRSESAAERVLRRERAARVREAIARLPRKQRAVLIMRLYQDLPHQEIALIIGTSTGAVKANYCHALQNLRRLLGEEAL
jgi:RNA polymerase sigma-70 factor (ECF subfamily)